MVCDLLTILNSMTYNSLALSVRAEFLKDGKIDKKLAEEARDNTHKQDDSEVSRTWAHKHIDSMNQHIQSEHRLICRTIFLFLIGLRPCFDETAWNRLVED